MATSSAAPRTPQSTVIPGNVPPKMSSKELTFSLPPPALGDLKDTDFQKPASKPAASHKKQPYVPLSPPSPAVALPGPSSVSKKRSRAASSASTVTLPPPPTRSRKIIQMKPGPTPAAPEASAASTATSTATSSSPAAKRHKKADPKESKDGAKEAKPTTATSRKVARKTAHSLIERRRRGKMNEEFQVLKGLIPACNGVEMHKLAILQAGIEYVRYLEGCVEELKKGHEESTSVIADASSATSTASVPRPAFQQQHQQQQQQQSRSNAPSEDDDDDNDDEEDEDDEDRDNSEDQEEVESQPPQTPWSTAGSPRCLPAISPGFPPADRRYSHQSYAQSYTDSPYAFQPSSSAALSSLPSILGEPRLRLPSISPLLFPLRTPVEDTEATAALLLLADADKEQTRRSSSGSGASRRGSNEGADRNRGMSVRDLLSA